MISSLNLLICMKHTAWKILQFRTDGQIFSANSITDKIQWSNITWGHGVKKILDKNSLPEKQKTGPQIKNGSKTKPRLGQGTVGIKCKKTQAKKIIDKLTDKLQDILKIPATQNIAKIRMDFPMHEQSMSNSKTETITWGMIQNINREIPFYPNPIYRPPPKPPENLWLWRIESKTDTNPRIDFEEIEEFEENSP